MLLKHASLLYALIDLKYKNDKKLNVFRIDGSLKTTASIRNVPYLRECVDVYIILVPETVDVDINQVCNNVLNSPESGGYCMISQSFNCRHPNLLYDRSRRHLTIEIDFLAMLLSNTSHTYTNIVFFNDSSFQKPPFEKRFYFKNVKILLDCNILTRLTPREAVTFEMLKAYNLPIPIIQIVFDYHYNNIYGPFTLSSAPAA